MVQCNHTTSKKLQVGRRKNHIYYLLINKIDVLLNHLIRFFSFTGLWNNIQKWTSQNANSTKHNRRSTYSLLHSYVNNICDVNVKFNLQQNNLILQVFFMRVRDVDDVPIEKSTYYRLAVAARMILYFYGA